MITYSSSSPYYLTTYVNGQYLDVMINRTFYPDPTDIHWEITSTYNLRPDMLAYDLYGDSRLWWIFAQRNPNMLKDPLFDFLAGKKIFLPKAENLKSQLGL